MKTREDGNHRRLPLLAAVHGNSKLEAELHRINKRRHGHVRGEWFDDCEEIQSLILDAQRSTDTVNDWLRLVGSVHADTAATDHLLTAIDVAAARRAARAKEQG